MVLQQTSIVWAPFYVNIAAAYAYDVAVSDAEGVADYIDSAVVNSAKGPCSAKDFAGALPPRPVRVSFLFFVPIIYTQCHRYQSSSYQFTVQVSITFHKEYFRIQNRVSSISL